MSLRISGGAISTTLYNDGRGVRRLFLVITRQVLFSCALAFLAGHEFLQTVQKHSDVEYERARTLVLEITGSAPKFEFIILDSELFLVTT